jgi:hypothetical protein
MTTSNFSDLSNDALLSSLLASIGNERKYVAQVIAHLMEVEDRRLYLDLAFPSMFEFCTRKLKLTESEAYRRIAAARLVRRFPRLLDPLSTGQLHLSGLLLLRDLFSEENLDDLIAAAAGKTKRQIEELVAKLAPKPPVAGSIRKLPTPSRGSAPNGAPLPAGGQTRGRHEPQVVPLADAMYKVQFTARAALRDKIEDARALMRHRIPSGDLAAVMEHAVDLLIAKLHREKAGKTARPRSTPAPTASARVTQATRREVAARDGVQCSFVGPDGERCASRSFLEIDHQHPKALGGTGDASNVRFLCAAHNRHAAEQVFGKTYIEKRIRSSQSNRKARRGGDDRAPRPATSGTDEGRSASTPPAWARPLQAIVKEAIDRFSPGLTR